MDPDPIDLNLDPDPVNLNTDPMIYSLYMLCTHICANGKDSYYSTEKDPNMDLDPIDLNLDPDPVKIKIQIQWSTHSTCCVLNYV